jgi:glucose-fructose oxidoreductase
VIGTKGDIAVSPAYSYTAELAHWLTLHERTTTRKFAKRDQFAALLVYFSNCILQRQQPEPSAAEGTIDVVIIEALTRSAKNGRPVKIKVSPRDTRPTMAQEITRPAGREPELVKVKPSH